MRYPYDADQSQTPGSHGTQRICNKVLNMTTLIYIILLCPELGRLSLNHICIKLYYIKCMLYNILKSDNVHFKHI